MSRRALLVRVHVHDGRFHGRPEWPPSPARLFQALVAGAAARLDEPRVAEALRWLEGLEPPVIGAPRHREGTEAVFYVPNNDLDAGGGDPEQVSKYRTAKSVRPRLLQGDVPFMYAWSFEGSEEHAQIVRDLTADLYQFGRGVDMAFASAEVVDDATREAVLSEYRGVLHRPSAGARDALACPEPGSLDSLNRRHAAAGERFQVEGSGRQAVRVFVQPPKARFRRVAYDCPPARIVFALRATENAGRFVPAALDTAHDTVVRWRDAATARLSAALGPEEVVKAVLVGRRPGEPEVVPASGRVRILPLPSIGHEHTDPRIRRLLVEVPATSPLSKDDVRWAFSGLTLEGTTLVPADGEDRMLERYTQRSSRWRSITPVVLPAARRRIDPERISTEAKDAAERDAEERRAISALHQALRHAGVDARAVHVEVSREPTSPGGRRAEAFASGPRFTKERLWHVTVEFDHSVEGPLALGDGRYLGLGVMVPEPQGAASRIWSVTGLASDAAPLEVAAVFRRAVLARAQTAWGEGVALPSFVTGHGSDGERVRGHRHLSYVADLERRRLILIDPTSSKDSRLAEALDGLTRLTAGRSGVLDLVAVPRLDDDPILGRGTTWRSVTPYRVCRHRRAGEAHDAIREDVLRECLAHGLPRPEVIEVDGIRAPAGLGLQGDVRISFAVSVSGPLLLGRTRHKGGGVFEVDRSR